MVSDDRELAVRASEELAAGIKAAAGDTRSTTVIGPGDAMIGKINNLYRRVIYVKCEDMNRLQKLREVADTYEAEGVSLAVDVNPLLAY